MSTRPGVFRLGFPTPGRSQWCEYKRPAGAGCSMVVKLPGRLCWVHDPDHPSNRLRPFDWLQGILRGGK